MADPQSSPSAALTIALGSLSNMLAPLNSTMLVVAMPRLMADLNVDVAAAGWLITGYLIVTAVVQVVAGTLGDRFGRRRLVIGGLLCFGFTSLGALAPNFGLVLAFRILQAASGAVTFPNVIALVRETIPYERRARAMGLIGGLISLAAALGPALGGVLAEAFGWRSIFLVNLVLVVPSLWLAWALIPNRQPAETETGFDWTGTGLLFVILVCASLLLGGAGQGWQRWLGWIAVAGALTLFIVIERRQSRPVVDPGLFRSVTFTAAAGAHALSNVAMYTIMVALPLLLAGRSGWSDSRTGFMLGAMSVANILTAPLGGWLSDRLGRRVPSVAGLALMTLALAALLAGGLGLAVPWLVAGLAVSGLGLGLSTAGRQTAAVESVSEARSGSAAGLYATFRYFGSVTGTSVLPVLLAGVGAAQGYTRVLLLSVGATLLATLCSTALRPHGDQASAATGRPGPA